MGLLKGVPPLLTADLLYILRSMGHGDKLCVCDCNFPASECATKTTSAGTNEKTTMHAISAILAQPSAARPTDAARDAIARLPATPPHRKPQNIDDYFFCGLR